MSEAMTRGVLFVHSAPTALCPHIEWAIGSVVDQRTDLKWTLQPAAPGMYRAEIGWAGIPGTGAKLASALRGWAHLRYEVTEEASRGVDGSRWSHTPELGIFHATTDSAGNIVVTEDRIRYAYEQGAGDRRCSTRSSRWRSGKHGMRNSSPSATPPTGADPLAAPGRLIRLPAQGRRLILQRSPSAGPSSSGPLRRQPGTGQSDQAARGSPFTRPKPGFRSHAGSGFGRVEGPVSPGQEVQEGGVEP